LHATVEGCKSTKNVEIKTKKKDNSVVVASEKKELNIEEI
jgi:hypothetical protein